MLRDGANDFAFWFSANVNKNTIINHLGINDCQAYSTSQQVFHSGHRLHTISPANNHNYYYLRYYCIVYNLPTHRYIFFIHK